MKKIFVITAGGFVIFILIGLTLLFAPKKLCEFQGGKLSATPGSGASCVLPTSDGGKKCTDNSQCQSFCEAHEFDPQGTKNIIGTCYEWKYSDCPSMVVNGKYKRGNCI